MDAKRLRCAGLPTVYSGPRNPQDVGEVFLREIESPANLANTRGRNSWQAHRPFRSNDRARIKREGADPWPPPRQPATRLEVKSDLRGHRTRRYIVRAAER